MLQWRGGSRRKVATSRKSTENRQKQYFEQRKRREQTVYPQNSESGTFRQDQQPKEHRSLDIQSLLNLSIIAKKSESARTNGDDCLKANNSKINYQSSNFPIGKPTNAHILIDPVEFKGPGTSQCNTHTVSPEKGVNNASSNQGKGTGDKMNHWSVFSEQNVSVFDLLDTDGTDRDSDFNPVNEDHVAFSVDDLGKKGIETAVHSEWGPCRDFPNGFSSPSRNSSYLHLSRNTSHAPYEPRHEPDSIGQDFNETFSPTALGSTFCRGNAFNIPNQETLGLWDDFEENFGHTQSRRKASGHGNSFSNKYNSNEDLWDGMPSLGENFFCERDFDVSRKHMGVDCKYNNNIRYECPGSSYPASDNVHLPKKRVSTMAGLGINISEYPAQNFRQRTSEEGWCGGLMDDPSDGLSSMSEESCSSTYKTSSRHTRNKHSSTSFGRTGNTMHQSGEHEQFLGKSNMKPFHSSGLNLQEKFSSDKNWSEKVYNPFHTNSDFNPFYNTTSLGFNLGKEPPLTVFPEPDPNLDDRFRFDQSNPLESTKVSPSSSFIETHAPHRTFREMDPDNFPSFCRVESGPTMDRPPISHHVASFFEEISLKECVDENENGARFEIRCFKEVHFQGKPCRASKCSWTPSENGESMDDLTCKDSNEVKDGTSDVESMAKPLGLSVETSSSTVLESNRKHEDMPDAAETHCVISRERVAKVDNTNKEDYGNSAQKVAMLGSCVFQLLCVQKMLREATPTPQRCMKKV